MNMKRFLLILGCLFLFWGQAYGTPLYYSFETKIVGRYDIADSEPWPVDGYGKDSILNFTFLIDFDDYVFSGSLNSEYVYEYRIGYVGGAFPVDAFTSLRAYDYVQGDDEEVWLCGSGPDYIYTMVVLGGTKLPDLFQLGQSNPVRLLRTPEGEYSASQQLVSISNYNKLPEPSALLLFGFGLLWSVGVSRKQNL